MAERPSTPPPPSDASDARSRPAAAARRSPKPVLRPRFTLSLLYTIAFFFLFAFVLAGPELLEAFRSLPPGLSDAEGRSHFERAAQEALSAGELLLALGVALALTVLGARSGRLPGLRAN